MADEVSFREINERIRETVASLSEWPWSRGPQPLDFVCECARATCFEQISVTRDAYDRARSRPGWFLVRPGHEIATPQRPVEQHPSYWIVEERLS